MRMTVLLTAVAIFCGSAATAQSAEPKAAASDPNIATLQARLQEKFPGFRIRDVQPAPVPGLYEFVAEGDVMYISADGRYLLDAQIFDIDSRLNITENKRAIERKQALARLDEKQMIVFAPASYKYTITVFTDVDCGYCQKLHNEMSEINKLGVRVRYLAFPRQGPGSDAWHKMEAVWCAKDRKTAITRAKQGQTVALDKSCNTNSSPVRSQFELGERLGVKGTPAVFTDSGKQIGGYVPAAQLIEVLKKQT
jgi:thiol:disulfide interchange protein DsbC